MNNEERARLEQDILARRDAWINADDETAQAADDDAGERAYKEIRLETLEKENDDLKTQIVNLASESIVLEQQNEELRAENAALKAENLRMKEALEYIALLEDQAAFVLVGYMKARALIGLGIEPTRIGKEALKLALQPAPLAQDEASEVTLAIEPIDEMGDGGFVWNEPKAPKKAIPARMRVNWNQRGFSSGSYEVLDYSSEKQCYMLNISTDANRPMLKAVKMADCLAVQA